jgi:PAS domain S-box-containing protein
VSPTPADPNNLRHLASERWFGDLADRGIIVTDQQLLVRAWNPWMAAHTGLTTEEVVGRSLFEVSPTIAARGLDEHYRRALEGEVRVLAHGFHKLLIPGRRPAGSGVAETTQSARIVPLLDQGQVVGTMTIIEDVSERVVSERELRAQIVIAERARVVAEDASKLKDEFLATLSHEIRTPLNAVLGWTQILRTRTNVGSPDRGLEVIERNAVSQLRLVEDLLDMARIVSGKLRLDIKSIDVRTIVQAAIDVVEPGAVAKRVSITSRFDDDGPVVNADVDRLQQAIWNVMSNAVKFTPSGGTVQVSVLRTGNVVDITIADSGQGIGADFLPYVFDRFRQADSSTSRRHGGLGLGLALTRQIIELHGGAIEVESDGVDRGSRFSIHLPVSDALPLPVDLPPRPSTADALTGIKVLLVDDSEDGREMLEFALRSYGAKVVTAASGEAGLSTLKAGTFVPDVIVSDIGMPGGDGYTFIRRVRELSSECRRTPAIALTAYAEPEDRIRALAAGYRLHLPKPVDPTLIADSIGKLVATDRALKERRPQA